MMKSTGEVGGRGREGAQPEIKQKHGWKRTALRRAGVSVRGGKEGFSSFLLLLLLLLDGRGNKEATKGEMGGRSEEEEGRLAAGKKLPGESH